MSFTITTKLYHHHLETFCFMDWWLKWTLWHDLELNFDTFLSCSDYTVVTTRDHLLQRHGCLQADEGAEGESWAGGELSAQGGWAEPHRIRFAGDCIWQKHYPLLWVPMRYFHSWNVKCKSFFPIVFCKMTSRCLHYFSDCINLQCPDEQNQSKLLLGFPGWQTDLSQVQRCQSGGPVESDQLLWLYHADLRAGC